MSRLYDLVARVVRTVHAVWTAEDADALVHTAEKRTAEAMRANREMVDRLEKQGQEMARRYLGAHDQLFAAHVTQLLQQEIDDARERANSDERIASMSKEALLAEIVDGANWPKGSRPPGYRYVPKDPNKHRR